jgi:hypothetical protein
MLSVIKRVQNSNCENVFRFKETGVTGTVFSILTNQIVQTDKLKIFPKVEKGEQVIEQGSTLTLTCIKDLSDNLIELRWTLPKFQTSLPAVKLTRQ